MGIGKDEPKNIYAQPKDTDNSVVVGGGEVGGGGQGVMGTSVIASTIKNPVVQKFTIFSFPHSGESSPSQQ